MASTKVNFNDRRFDSVEKKEKQALTENEQLYGGMVKGAEKFYNKQINESKRYAKEQSKIQQQQTDFAIQQVEQQKAQAKKDYTREQAGAYKDWQKQSNQYGVAAEQRASSGLQNTGYSESSQVSMYNTYQNRVATARESYNTAVQNYNNSITQARLQNNATLAEIAHNALQKQLELSLQGYQYKNQLLLDKADKKLQIKNTYYNQWKDVLNQINTENSLAEQKRQFNAEQALKKAQLAEDRRQFNANLAENRRQFNVTQANKTKKVSIKDNSKVITNGKKGKYELETEYYRGDVSQDIKNDIKQYGTFSNGYQPKGVNWHGKFVGTAGDITFDTQTLSGKKQKLTQTVWVAEDGSRWYWQGRENKYLPVPKQSR